MTTKREDKVEKLGDKVIRILKENADLFYDVHKVMVFDRLQSLIKNMEKDELGPTEMPNFEV